VPTMLQQQGYALQSAGNLTALAVLANALGNAAASALVARALRPASLIAISCAGMALTACGVYAPGLTPMGHYLFVVAFAAISGLAPACLFALVPAVAPDRRASATVMGFVVQASHSGQLLGPPIVAAAAAAAGGWQYSPLLTVPAATIALLLALQLRHLR
jgi:MFS transporter, CP family, cyanate transporter